MDATQPRRAVVTGASRGIGRATALTLAAAGWDVAITGRTVNEGEGRVPPRTQAEGDRAIAVPGSLASTVAGIEAHGGRALAISMDLNDLASVQGAAESVLASWGGVELVVNNAVHHLAHARFMETAPETLVQSMLANHVHQVAFIQALLPSMVAAGHGTVVNIVSGSAQNDPPAPPGEGGWSLAYAGAKAAFGRVAGSINAEYVGAGIRAFNVDPGFVVTESGAARGGTKEIEEKGFATTPPDAAGVVIRWLAESPESTQRLGRIVKAAELHSDLR
ncbi:SDR family NAD(P)-dependent oxidoreductase [Nocardioides alcanivorans]|uniref:SDR family NAD(P)-dependent oxidoreductase n=1 Tax=Nocardioides alcanivorans TaxID=2897352 RepID=UPI001F4083E8|nr:SDR family oxidoreductase [Nocardioides alcanivorans]